MGPGPTNANELLYIQLLKMRPLRPDKKMFFEAGPLRCHKTDKMESPQEA